MSAARSLRPAWGIRSYLVILVLAAALPLAALDTWNLYDTYQTDARDARAQVFHLAQITAANTARFLDQAQNILNGMAARPAVRALDPSRCDPILRDFISLAPRFTNAVTLVLDGTIVCSAVPFTRPTRLNPRMLLNRLRGPDELTVGGITRGTITGKWAAPIGRPLLDARGEVTGAVTLTIDLVQLPVLPSVEGLSARAIVGIVAADGTVIAHSGEPERFVGTNIRHRPETRRMLAEKSGTAEDLGLDDIPRIRGYTPIPGTDWIAVASLPASEVYAAAKARIAVSALAGFAVLIVALLLASRWGRRIYDPIASLADTAGEVAAGNLAARATVEGAAETAEVGTQFNRMLDARDLTEAALRDSEAKYRRFVEHSPDPMFAHSDGRIVLANAAMADLIGAAPGQLLGTTVLDIIAPADREIVKARIAKVVHDLPVPRAEVRFVRLDGSVVPVEAAASPIRHLGEPAALVTARDITERKRADAEIRETSRRLGTLIDNLPGVAYRCRNDPEWTTEFVSQGILGLTGYASGEFSAGRIQIGKLILAEDRDRVWETVQRAVEAKSRYEIDYRLRTVSGEIKWVWDRGCGVYGEDGVLLALEGFVTDVTDRRRAEEALRESEEKLRLFVDHAPSAIAMFDRDMRYVAFSRRWLRDYGLGDRDITGLSHYEVFPDLPERWKEIHRKCLAGAIEKAEEDPFPRGDGSVDWVRWEVHPWHARDGGIGGIIIFSEVITERKQAEQRLRELSRRLLEVEEAERRAISRELHDRIGQNLSALNLNLGIVRGQLATRLPRAVSARFDDARKLLETTSQQVRDVIAELRPAALDDYGLLAAPRVYVEPYSQRVGIPVSVHGQDFAPRPPLATEMALFRIAQEALANAAKHARARNVNVTLGATPHSVSLAVADDGVGFDPQAIKQDPLHWGMATMRERAEALGAALRVESAPGKGTRVVVEAPTA